MTAAKQTTRPILIEGHNLVLPSGTGIATYARTLASGLMGMGHDVEVLIGTSRGVDKSDPVLSEIGVFDMQRPPYLGEKIMAEWRRITTLPVTARPVRMPHTRTVIGPTVNALRPFSAIHALPHLMERERFYFKRYGKLLNLKLDSDVGLFHATRVAGVRVPRVPNIYTIHDIVPLRLPYTTADDKKYFLNLVRHLCKTADHIVTVSEFSRQDIIQLTGIDEKRITNTYQPVQIPRDIVERPKDTIARELETLFGLDYQGYFLFFGAIEPKKNVSRLVDAYAASGSKNPLIIAGGLGWNYEGDLKKIEDERFSTQEIVGNTIHLRKQVRHLSYLPTDQLMTLLMGARAVVFPSIYEGFGLPILEAMTLGVPVITSNVSSLPEIAGDAAILVDPYDVNALTQAIRQVDADADLRAEMSQLGLERARAFGPETYIERLKSVYSSLM